MTEVAHILVVDDDPRIRELLRDYLEDEGFKVTGAADGGDMRACMSEAKFDLVILDLTLPGDDGLSLTRELRAVSDVPIIIVTGKGDVVDRVTGLEVGADDYITKPFELREILARVRAILRRARPDQPDDDVPPQSHATSERIQFDHWELDLARRELYMANGSPVALTTGEFNLLAAFANNPNRVLNRDQLMDLVRGQDWNPFDRSIDTQVGRLRKKIETDPGTPQIIKTVRGIGYIFTAKVEPL